MARVLWFVVRDADGGEVGASVEFERAQALRRRTPGGRIVNEWRAEGPLVVRRDA